MKQENGSSAVSLLPCFILDSGASLHAVGDKSSLSEFTTRVPAGMTTTYHARDGRKLTVAGVGTISCDNFHLSDVLYVPGLRAGVVLVSVQQLAGRGYLAMFGGGRCSVKDPSSGEIVGKGRLHDDGLYHLDEFLNIQPPDTTNVTE